MSKDLYQVLGISKNASEAEIKSAYRKLARRHHPDVNKDNKESDDKFKELSCAYDILGDKEKRAKYDKGEIDCDGKPTGYGAYSHATGANPFGNSGFNFQDTGGFDFSSIFGEDIFSQFAGGGRGSRRAQKGQDIAYNLSVDFLSAVNGDERTVSVMGKNVSVKIPAGTQEGQTLRLKNLGQPGINNGPNGDALITISIKKHAYFSADGNNILLDLPISMKEAVLGAKITVPTISGKVAISIPPYSSSGDKMRLKGKGIKSGDQIITLKIIAPKKKDSIIEQAFAALDDEKVRSF